MKWRKIREEINKIMIAFWLALGIVTFFLGGGWLSLLIGLFGFFVVGMDKMLYPERYPKTSLEKRHDEEARKRWKWLLFGWQGIYISYGRMSLAQGDFLTLNGLGGKTAQEEVTFLVDCERLLEMSELQEGDQIRVIFYGSPIIIDQSRTWLRVKHLSVVNLKTKNKSKGVK